MSIAYLNGRYLPLAEARVSVLDRGFLFADGVYEVVAVYRGKIFAWDLHWARLCHSLAALQIPLTLAEREWLEIVAELIQKSKLDYLTVYLQITRGSEDSRNPYYQDAIQPTLFATVSPLSLHSIQDIKPTRVISQPDYRWSQCNIKSIGLLPNVMARQVAYRQGATEALLIRDGQVNEGASSNLFIVKNNTLITPPLSPLILPGITRQVTLELAERHHIPVELRNFNLAEVHSADEVWITSTGREIQPVIQVDDKAINQGRVGTLWPQMIQYLYDYKKEVLV